MPEGKGEEGDEIELVDTWRVKPDGKLCLVEFDGHKMPGYDGDYGEAEPDKEDKRGYADAAADAMEEDMQQGGGGPTGPRAYA